MLLGLTVMTFIALGVCPSKLTYDCFQVIYWLLKCTQIFPSFFQNAKEIFLFNLLLVNIAFCNLVLYFMVYTDFYVVTIE